MKTFLTYWIYPLSWVATVAAAWLLRQLGLPYGAVIPAVSLFFIGLCFWLERSHRDTPHWRHDRTEITSDVLHACLSNTIPTWIFRVLFYALIVEAAARLEGSLGFGWPTHWPLLAQIVLVLVASELAAYWIHRTLHSVSWLWPLHAVHHCSRNMYSLIGLRKHPIQTMITYGGRLTFLWLIGTPAEILMYYTLIAGTNSMLQHASFETRAGPLNWILATPELHRWHHSKEVAESNRNFGDILIVWDVVFGTRILPSNVEKLYDGGVGLPDGTRVDQTYWGHLKLPFVWSRVQPQAAAAPAPSREGLAGD